MLPAHLEPNPALPPAPADLPAGDACADMQEAIEARLGEAGYANYETSAFARHSPPAATTSTTGISETTWGSAGAHSKLTLHDRVLRQMRWKHPAAYLKTPPPACHSRKSEVGGADLPFEFLERPAVCRRVPAWSFRGSRTARPIAAVLAELWAA